MNPTAALALDRDAVRLSDAVRATITIDGPAPLAVVPPAEVLTDESAAVWLCTPDGPPTLEVIPGGTRWTQAYTLSPFVAGDAVPVAFRPFEVTSGGRPAAQLEVPARSVSVTTTLAGATAADARPVTGIEELPSPAGGAGAAGVIPFVSAAAVVGLVVAVVLARRKRAAAPLPPATWAARELDAIDPDDPAAAEKLAAVLRAFLERRHGVPATRRTTSELATEPGFVEALHGVLDWCDGVKFAGRAPAAADDCRKRIAEARQVASGEGERPA